MYLKCTKHLPQQAGLFVRLYRTLKECGDFVALYQKVLDRNRLEHKKNKYITLPKAFRSSSRTAEVNFLTRQSVVTTANSRLYERTM